MLVSPVHPPWLPTMHGTTASVEMALQDRYGAVCNPTWGIL